MREIVERLVELEKEYAAAEFRRHEARGAYALAEADCSMLRGRINSTREALWRAIREAAGVVEDERAVS
jgi:hypothetical protein